MIRKTTAGSTTPDRLRLELMAEQTIERPHHTTATRARRSSPTGSSPAARTGDALKDAKAYLESADRRLRRGDASQADEILRLLHLASASLETALLPGQPGYRYPSAE